LTALVALSTLTHWLAGRRLDGLWILPDEGVYATRATDLWRHGSLPLLHGQGSGYGVLYPLIAGLPLSLGSVAHGYAALKLVQALVMSLAAVPVFVFGRRLMPAGYALVAATLTVASPLLLYSGLVMTEVLFYPLAAAALLAVASAVSAATVRSQVVAFAAILAAALTRPQAVVFVGIFAAAILLDAVCARDRSLLYSFWPTWLVVGGSAVALIAFPSLVGSYADTLRGGYPVGAGLRLSFEHLSFVALASGLVPAVAVALLTARATRGLERDPTARALISVCASASVLLSVQVGFYAARYAPHLLGRDLAPLPPLLFLAFALWLARGAPRTAVSGPLAAFGVLALVLLSPWNTLVSPGAFADTPDLLLIARLHGHQPVNVVIVFSLLMLAVFVGLPRRASLLAAVSVVVVLISSSAVASNELHRVVSGAQTVLGPDRSWIDRNADANVGYVYAGESYWNVVWQERFWNRRIDRVYSIEPNSIPGPIQQTAVRVAVDGRMPIAERYIVAADRLAFVGTPVAHLAQEGLDISGLTLWKLSGPARLSTVKNNVQPNGDMTRPATITVYRCTDGRLELTLIPKATNVVRVLLDGRVVLRQSLRGLKAWHGAIRVPATSDRPKCTFTIVPTPLLGSTNITFRRGA
jgi:hypothetical protein